MRVEPLGSHVRALAAMGVGGLALAVAYQQSGGRLGLPCLLRTTTGLDCPLCGSTRMAAALLRGDVAAAWAFNPVVLAVAPVVAAAVGYQVLAWSLERTRLLRLPRLRLSDAAQRWSTWGLIVALTAFGVLRNIGDVG